MSTTLELMAATYTEAEQAETTVDMLQQMHRASNITLADAAIVTKDAEGKVHIKETQEVTAAKGAKRGAIVAGVFGLIFPPSLIVSALAGGAVGGAWGKLRDTGIKTGDMKQLAEDLQPGTVLVVALAEPESVPAIERALENSDGQIVRHGFSAEETEQIEQAVTEAPTEAPTEPA
jgi:uncharacterized membrane protein